MLSDTSSINSLNPTTITSTSVPCWPQIELALNQLLPSPQDLFSHVNNPNQTGPSTLSSDNFLKLYTLVFEHCVGPVENKKSNSNSVLAGLNASAEELYMTLVKYIEIKFTSWSQHLVNKYKVLLSINVFLD